MRLLTLIFLAFLLSPALAFAGQFEEGRAAYINRDYKTAFEKLRPLAEEGDPVAQYLIGEMYHRGKGVEADAEEAVKWYLKSADQAPSVTQSMLDALYAHKEKKGSTIIREEPLGPVAASAALSYMYANGIGVKQDSVQAYMWESLYLARNAGFNDELNLLSQGMTPEQLQEARRLAVEKKQVLPTISNEVYGTDMNSKDELALCEQKTGKKCLFELCDEGMYLLHTSIVCKPGWKPTVDQSSKITADRALALASKTDVAQQFFNSFGHIGDKWECIEHGVTDDPSQASWKVEYWVRSGCLKKGEAENKITFLINAENGLLISTSPSP